MNEDSDKPPEIFVAVRIGQTWGVIDTRNGQNVAAGQLTQFESMDLAALLNTLVPNHQSDQPHRPA